MPWTVLHVDLDQFVVAVELQRHPELAGRPVLVGGTGDPSRRGVVAGASYEARARGVRSGTPLRTAARRLPDAVFLPVDRDAYLAASDRVRAVLEQVPAVLEPLGWDEAYLGVDTGDPQALARRVQADVLAATGLACSVGIGDNRLQAKTATGFGKPAGVFTLTSATWGQVVGPQPVSALQGVGPRTTRALAALGLRTVADLAAAPPALLAALGPTTGPRLQEAARGQGPAHVRPEAPAARSRGREETFEVDVEEPGVVREALRRLTARLVEDLADEPRPVARVVVTVRTRPFRTRSRGVAVRPPTRRPDELEAAALQALDLLAVDAPVRLVGVRAELVRPG